MAVLLVGSAVPAVVPTAAAQSGNAQVAIEEIQRPDGATDASPYAGETVTTAGTVTAVVSEGYYVQNGTGAYSGVYVYTGSQPSVAPGDAVAVTAPVTEYYNLTELDATAESASTTVTGTAPAPDPVALDTGAVGAERYEGVLVTVSNATATATPGQYGEWTVDDGSGAVAVDDVTAGDATTPNETGRVVTNLTGPLFYSFGAFKIQPQAVGPITAPPDDGSEGDDGSAGDGGAPGAGTPANATTLTLLSYNDVQTAASNPTAMGRLAGAVNERRGAHDNPTVVVGGGDQVSPSSLSPVSNWTVPVAATNAIDPAADVVGNHDLDYGFDAVPNYTAASEYPWLLANVRAEDGGGVPGTENYTIVERDGVRVGIVGLVDEAIEPKTAVDFDEAGYEVADYSEVGAEVATELKTEENVDVVVAAAHIGVGDSKELARETENIDVIVTGDDEVAYEPQVTDGAVIMEAEGRAAYLGELNLTVGANGSVAMADGRLLSVAGEESVPVNETVEGIVSSARGEYLSAVIGRTTVPLDSTFAANYHDETAWGNLVTDAFRAQTGAEVAVTNAGGIRGDFTFSPGNVTYDDVYTSLPFGNTLVTKRLSGAELTELLASQVVTLESGGGQQYGQEAQLQVSGVTYEMVAHEGADSVVRDVYVGGEPLRANATYNVTVNSYMAGWDDLADDPTVSTDLTLYGTAVADYIERQGTVSPRDTNRIRRVDREVGTEWIFAADGSTVPVHYEVPEAVVSVNDSAVRVENATGAALAAERVRLTGDDLLVSFDRGDFGEFAAASDHLQLYAGYTDAEYDGQRSYFDDSVLNGDLEGWESLATENGSEPDDGGGEDRRSPRALRADAVETVDALDADAGRYESARDRASERFDGSREYYRGPVRTESATLFTDDAVGVQALTAFAGTGGETNATAAADLVVRADNRTAAREVADARRLLNDSREDIDSEGVLRSMASHLDNADRMYDRAERTMDRARDAEGRRAIRLRASAIRQLRQSWRQAHRVVERAVERTDATMPE
ncbi:UDP-sugar hydrolase / 5'-nucleotidase [Halosimplex carlsbadense 2-9-1]|uniref:UDP-sugar hydrolase / 5'-nucleotidase n=1 Tax=Halosimplex carlsbadense 2-9-1 TaxID=797114 RepID=M0CR34_9EURY|nr:5'-nucleotidase C-terminal domain-containing protein [Halosimplex carlsbadense]ELZ24344.1 UDP-sugar hydrolase / 5'-nucleotidase [Halosimplex carlsbadense 2-9-1]